MRSQWIWTRKDKERKMEQPILEIRKAEVCYDGRCVLRDISLTVEKGTILAAVGESGSGKSTMIRACMGLLKKGGAVTGGDILYKGQSVLQKPQKELRRLRGPEMATIFQDSQNAFCPVRRIGVQLFESMKEHQKKITRNEAMDQARTWLERTGLSDPDRILRAYPFELSGGMSQRVGIAAAMLMQPDLLFADEPTSALDVTVQAQVIRELMKLRQEYGTSIVLVTHNLQAAAQMADEIAVFQNGRIVEYAPTRRLIEDPKQEYTRRLLQSVPRLRRNTAG